MVAISNCSSVGIVGVHVCGITGCGKQGRRLYGVQNEGESVMGYFLLGVMALVLGFVIGFLLGMIALIHRYPKINELINEKK